VQWALLFGFTRFSCLVWFIQKSSMHHQATSSFLVMTYTTQQPPLEWISGVGICMTESLVDYTKGMRVNYWSLACHVPPTPSSLRSACHVPPTPSSLRSQVVRLSLAGNLLCSACEKSSGHRLRNSIRKEGKKRSEPAFLHNLSPPRFLLRVRTARAGTDAYLLVLHLPDAHHERTHGEAGGTAAVARRVRQ
jgi:hypothetical protein